MVGKEVYPLKLKPVLEKTVWGGSSLRKFRRIEDSEDYGISWEVTAHPNATNEIINGVYKGQTLLEVLSKDSVEIIGEKVSYKDVLRVSYINAKHNLSVQVHPYIKKLEQNEIWYILEAPKGAEVILGVNVDNKDALAEKIRLGQTEDILTTIPVSVGDFVYIPGGLVHALTSGITVIEVGQNHDNTYRLYDYNRGRDIHVNESIEHTLVDMKPLITRVCNDGTDAKSSIAYRGNDFTVELIEGQTEYRNTSNKDYYYVYTNLGVDCKFGYQDEVLDFERGESILVPAYLGDYSIVGDLKLLKSYLT